jgi:hypothetical protein
MIGQDRQDGKERTGQDKAAKNRKETGEYLKKS